MDLSECADAFNVGRIDGFVSADNVVSSYSGITPVEKIGKQPFYLCVAKERTDLLGELNMAVPIVNEQDAADLDELRSKYFTETTVSVFLSEQEREWMAEHDSIAVGYLDNYLPYCDTDKDGTVTGLVADIMPDLIDALPGDYKPEITYRSFENQQEMLDSLKNGEVDCVLPVSDGSWYSEQAGDDKAKVQDYLSKIQVSGNHLLGIVNEVLEISRIESGQTRLEEAPCSIADIVNETDVIIREQALEKKQEFLTDISEVQDLYVFCDKLRVKEILVNLLSNSVKYTQTGGKISLRILQLPCEKGGYGNYEIRVKDNGCGMSPDFLKRVFQPFERQASTTISGVQGTGLGMTIVKGFVEIMGGNIEIRSKEKKGTEILVKLQYRLAEEPQQTAVPEVEYPAELFAGKRILLAEDNVLNREIAVAILEETGFQVEIAENGAVAVERVKAAPAGYYDAVLMDIQMPVMDGYAATRAIRALEEPGRSDIPVIAVSANAFDEDMEASREAGMNGHLAKPIIVPELLEMLGKILFP